MLRLFKEPLVHFLLLGAAIFVWFELARDPAITPPQDEIVVTRGQVERLGALFEKTWQRPPTPAERKGLIEEYIREEVYYREALAVGLDRDDTIVRRRMRQKLEFLTQDIADLVEPTEDDLRAYLEVNPDAFRREPTFTFRHVYLDSDRRESVEEDAGALLAQLRAKGGGTDTASVGDSLLMIEPAFKDAPQRDVQRALGGDFAAKLLELPTGEWTGPITSAFGLHLVFLESRTEGRIARLDEVRGAVARDWGAARRREMREGVYQELRKKYTITVEMD